MTKNIFLAFLKKEKNFLFAKHVPRRVLKHITLINSEDLFDDSPLQFTSGTRSFELSEKVQKLGIAAEPSNSTTPIQLHGGN